MSRCTWCGDDPLYVDYHDNEWGRPVTDADRLFEKICLEGFQSGLAWITVLRKRENFRRAFGGFTIDAVSAMSPEADMERLLADAGIIRHRGKIQATLTNARCARDMRDSGTDLGAWFWSHAVDAEPGDGITSPASHALSKELKRRGWRFVGPTTVYSFMQSMGMVNDHAHDCDVRAECETERQSTLARMPRG